MSTTGRVTSIGALLVLATFLSWYLSTTRLEGLPSIATVVVVIAFVKVRLVGLHFMGLREAPMGLRALFEAYVITACLAVLTAYFV
jgi:hypothetical protein